MSGQTAMDHREPQDQSIGVAMSVAEAAPPIVPSPHAVAVISRWQVTGRQAQRAAADAVMARWQHLPWPEGCLEIACLLSTDGELVLFYAQWTDEQAHRRHTASQAERADEVGLDGTHLDTVVSRLAGPAASRSADGPYPGCIALITIQTDSPDHQRQAAELIAAVAADLDPGGIGGHLLFGLDGTRVILYAEWISEEAHREAVAGAAYGGPRGIFGGTPGIQGLSMNRYQLYRSIHPATGPA
jgi:quinol monooxygenase YgiN